MSKLKEIKKEKNHMEKKNKKNIPLIPLILISLIVLAVISFVYGFVFLSKESSSRIDSAELVNGSAWAGTENAEITIVVFSDFECMPCRENYWKMKNTLAEFEGKIKYVFRHFPATKTINSFRAAAASKCAQEKNLFWEYHDKLFESAKELNEKELISLAKESGLNEAEFIECLYSGKFDSEIQKDINDALRFGAEGAPTYFINGLKMQFSSWQEFNNLIETELLR
ncbi:MAG: DsbA family protein [Candidatus Diapherotrites archaeon]